MTEGDLPAHVDILLSQPPKLRELREALSRCDEFTKLACADSGWCRTVAAQRLNEVAASSRSPSSDVEPDKPIKRSSSALGSGRLCK
jgi:hypothetical protein